MTRPVRVPGLARAAWRTAEEVPCPIRVLLPLTAAFLVSLPTSTVHARKHRHSRCHTARCVERVAMHQCSQTHVIACIRRAALHRRQPFADMLRVARCESSLDPFSEYAGHHGLYQFLVSTWATTPYASRWIYNAKWQALATAWMWQHHRRNEWACR